MKLKAVSIAIFSLISLIGCSEKVETYDNGKGVVQAKNDYYKNQNDCIKDWGSKEYCKPEIEPPYLTGANSSNWSGIGSPGAPKIPPEAVPPQTIKEDQTTTASSGSSSSYSGGGGFYGFFGPTYVQNGQYGSRAFTNDKGSIVKPYSNTSSGSVTSKIDSRYGNRLAVSSNLANSLSKGTSSKTQVQSARSGSRGFFSSGGGRSSSGG